MAKLNATKTLAAVTLAAVTLTTPAIAQANNYSNANYSYEDCKRADGENQLIGGLLGAVAGGVLGSQVAGNGARTEGSAIGALLGGGLGVAIGDDQRRCKELKTASYDNAPRNYNSGYSTANQGVSSSRTVYTSPRVQTVNAGYSYGNQSYGNQSYGYKDSAKNRLRRIENRIDSLKYEHADLKKRLKYDYDPYIARRLDEIDYELSALKKQKKRVKREVRRNTRHYHGSNACYSYH